MFPLGRMRAALYVGMYIHTYIYPLVCTHTHLVASNKGLPPNQYNKLSLNSGPVPTGRCFFVSAAVVEPELK